VKQRHASKVREPVPVLGNPLFIHDLITANGWPDEVLDAVNVVFAHDNADVRTASGGEKY
jgi:hypothetical protein